MPEKDVKDRMLKAVHSFTDEIDAIAKEFDLDFGKLLFKALDLMVRAFETFAEIKNAEHKKEE